MTQAINPVPTSFLPLRARVAARRLFSIPGAFLLAMLLVLTPLVGSNFSHAADAPASVVNINKADAQLLASSLKGVGLSRAMEIIRYRETYGPFTSVDELTEVKGIGMSTVEKNRAVITLE